MGGPIRRGVHAPLRRRGQGGETRGRVPRRGAQRRGEAAPRPAALDPRYALPHAGLADALEEHRRAFDLAPDSAFIRPVLARSLALAGRSEEARALVAAAEASPYQLATVHLALGEVERAEDLLAEAARRLDPWIVILAVDPMMRPLRGRPLFEDLVRRVSGGPTP